MQGNNQSGTDIYDVYLYTGNHGENGNLDGIEDYLVLFAQLLNKRGYSVQMNSVLNPDGINIVIDEFTSCIENKKIAEFKTANPNCRLVFVLTEFPERKWGVASFNHFGGIIDSSVIALFNVYLRNIREDFPENSLRDYATLAFYSPLLALYFLANSLKYLVCRLLGKKADAPVAGFIRRFHRVLYFHMRYLGLLAQVKHADAVITSHECIMPNLVDEGHSDRKQWSFLGVIYPELDEEDIVTHLLQGKEPFVEITGSVTPYRKKWLRQLNTQISLLGIQNFFGKCKELPFAVLHAEKKKKIWAFTKMKRGAFSLHPPQTKSWPYSSPTRLYRALAVEYNLPVLTKHFAQNPIEDVCYVYNGQNSMIEIAEMFTDRERLLEFIRPRIQQYNQIVVLRNDHLIQCLINE